MNATEFFGVGGGGGGAIYNCKLVLSSQSFVAPLKTKYLITCIGGGGGGSSTGGPRAGGGAGGFAQIIQALDVGATLTAVIGAAGAAGAAGGASTVTGSGLSLTANGGGAGLNNTPGAGGTATGGSTNYQGGSGRLGGGYSGGGGGAVSIYGVVGTAITAQGGSSTGVSVSSADPSGVYGEHSLLNSRLLSPVGYLLGAPGCIGQGAAYTGGGTGGLFAGGNGGYDSNTAGYGAGGGGSGGLGAGGGGGAGGYGAYQPGGPGGAGLVLIEWFTPLS